MVAELGACFLSGPEEIENYLPVASYIASWLAALHGDKRFIFAAAKLASAAAAYIAREPDSLDQMNP